MAGHLMVGLSQSHDVIGAGLYPAMNSSIEARLADASIPLWHLGKRPGFDPSLFSALDQVFKRVRPHVVHTHLSVLRYALPGLIRRRVPAVVHTLHNLAQHETDRVGRLLQWFAFRRAVLPVAISREVAASVASSRPVSLRQNDTNPARRETSNARRTTSGSSGGALTYRVSQTLMRVPASETSSHDTEGSVEAPRSSRRPC